jgi:uncharacterized membrane protein YeaQ/YmgE (transglycosylase-associated protein family)
MNVVAWIATGIVAGWLANRFLNYESPNGRMGYIAFGIAGAFMGVQLLAPPVDPMVTDREVFSLSLLMFSAVGAATLLLVGNALKQRFFP